MKLQDLLFYFKHVFKIELGVLKQNFNSYSNFELLTSLQKMINENIIIHNMYGIQSFLREDDNIFFLVDSISNQNNLFSNFKHSFKFFDY